MDEIDLESSQVSRERFSVSWLAALAIAEPEYSGCRIEIPILS
ncbi:hypothetical protein AVDCRST_MAG94-1575 [uncultured Leptolyngbya sp.]|uniref:Uncharacterized protein n=1 Tax=uncultured Leptolyngbya sp. TaxID=332963 RepID=A0A6J4LAH5_9CYAN|nr:hypothetical protein AVDCRST_MAG94-1575 [uncultured Leptolyngbya sp.]